MQRAAISDRERRFIVSARAQSLHVESSGCARASRIFIAARVFARHFFVSTIALLDRRRHHHHR